VTIPPEIQKPLRQLYKELAAHTAPECAGKNQGCKVPHRCCSPEACDMAQGIAKDLWDTDVSHLRDHHNHLPFMGENGCVLEPHLRPLCSRHVCCIKGIGAKTRGEDAGLWTYKYYEILEKIEALEAQLIP